MLRNTSSCRFFFKSTPILFGAAMFKPTHQIFSNDVVNHVQKQQQQQEQGTSPASPKRVLDMINSRVKYQQELELGQQKNHVSSEFRDDGKSFYFVSGYEIPAAIVELIKKHPIYIKQVANNGQNPSLLMNRLFFTEAQLRRFKASLHSNNNNNNQEQGMTITCPPGVTRKPTLVLYCATQTNKQEEDIALVNRENKAQKNNDNNISIDVRQEKNKKENANQQQHHNSFVGVPQYFGGMKYNNNNNDNNNISNDQLREIPHHVWPTLASIASHNSWTSKFWYTRSGMKSACLRPKMNSNNNRDMLPVVVHFQKNASSNKNNNNKFSAYQTLWNADQLEAILDFAETMDDEESNVTKLTSSPSYLASIFAEIERELSVQQLKEIDAKEDLRTLADVEGKNASNLFDDDDEIVASCASIFRQGNNDDVDQDGCVICPEQDKFDCELEEKYLLMKDEEGEKNIV